MASRVITDLTTHDFSQMEIEKLAEKCPNHAAISAHVMEVGGQFVAELRIVFDGGFFHARSRCASFVLAKRHCLTSIYAQIRHWRSMRFRRERERKRLASQAGPRGLPRILIVDDDPVSSRLAAAAFRKAACEVITVYSGADGLAEISRGGYDLVLLDWFLGDMDGEDLLKKANAGLGLPVVIWSGRMSAVGDVHSNGRLRVLERWDKVSSPDQLIDRTKRVVRDLDLGSQRIRARAE